MTEMEGSIRLGDGAAWTECRPMTRCECAEISFDEVLRRMHERGLTLEQVCEATGCGRTCTACMTDLRAHARRAR